MLAAESPPSQMINRARRGLALTLMVSAVLGVLGTLVLTRNQGEPLASQLYLLGVLTSAVVGGLVASRQPRHPVGWLLLLSAACYAVSGVLGVLSPSGSVAAVLGRVLVLPALTALLVFMPLVFPDGHLPSRRWRPVAMLVGVAVALIAVYWAVRPEFPHVNPLEWSALTPFVPMLDFAVVGIGLGMAILSATGVLVRFRRASGVEQRQLRWLMFAAAAWMVGVFSGFPIGRFAPSLVDVHSALLSLVFAALPLSVGVAVLRYRLYDIDLIINRTLVYASLTALVTSAYATLVVLARTLLPGEQQAAAPLTATFVVAVLFAPLRDAVQRAINRLLYGQRDAPEAALSALGRRLENSLGENALPVLASTIAETLKLPYVAVRTTVLGTERIVASSGQPPAGTALLAVPLTTHSETVGTLLFAARAANEDLTDADWRLLRDLARQASGVVRSVQLASELRVSRERLVTVQEEERRRIQRDLHDGLGPLLASMRLRLEACLDLSEGQRELSGELEHLDVLVTQASSDVRRLVLNLCPPVIGQLGLLEALRQHTWSVQRDCGLRVHLEVDCDVLDWPAATEVAVYRIVQEALLNVHRHARASRVHLTIQHQHHGVVLRMSDDGIGLPSERGDGTGLIGMRDRAELLGGRLTVRSEPGHGTTLEAFLPLEGAS